MKIQLIRQYNFLKEALDFYRKALSEDSFSSLKISLSKKAFYSPVIERKINLMDKIYDEVLESVDTTSDDIKMYFTPFKFDSYCNIADGIVSFMYPDNIDKEHPEKNAISQFENSNGAKFIESILGNAGEMGNTTTNKLDIFKTLEQSSLSPEEKWNVLKVFNNFPFHAKKIADIVFKTGSIIEKVYRNNNMLDNDFLDYWQEQIDNGLFFEAFSNESNIILEHNYYEFLKIYPCCMALNSIGVYNGDKDNNCYIYIGTIFMGDKVSAKCELSESEIMTCLKLLGDPSKFEILKLIKEQPMYGGEIAKALGLTTATISHHMSSLTSAGLVVINQQQNKVYYQSSGEKLAMLLNSAKEKLL